MQESLRSQNESCPRGNALFLVLIAVALFAALSYAVTQSGRGGGSIDRETAMIAAGRITQYASGLRAAVTRMVLSGTAATAVDFTNPGTGLTTQLFDHAGGNAVSEFPPTNIGNPLAAWGYKDLKDNTLGYYIEDVGTNTNTSGREAVAYLHDISLIVCQQINKGLGLPAGDPPYQNDVVDFTLNGGKGALYGAGHNLNNYYASAGHAFACVHNGSAWNSVHDYYHALIEQ